MAFARASPFDRGGSEARDQPVYQPGKLDCLFGLPAEPGLDRGERFDRRGAERDQVEPETGIDPLQLAVEQAANMFRVAGRVRGGGRDPRRLPIRAIDREHDAARAKPGLAEAFAKLPGQLRKIRNRVLNRFREARLGDEPGRIAGGIHRLGHSPHHLVETDERIPGRIAAAKAPCQRQARHGGQRAGRLEAEAFENLHGLRVQPEGPDRKRRHAGGEVFGSADLARGAQTRKCPSRSVSGSSGQAAGKTEPGQSFLDVAQHRGFAAPQMVRASRVHHDAGRPVHGGPRTPAAGPQHELLQGIDVPANLGLLHEQPGAESSHVGDTSSLPDARLFRGAVGGMDHRTVGAIAGERYRQVPGRHFSSPVRSPPPAFDGEAREPDRCHPAHDLIPA